MNELQKAIQKHLGVTLDGESVNYYQLLQVSPDANLETINRALKEAADKWNRSDRKSNPDAAKKVATLIKEAQSVLLDPNRRRAYDSSLPLAWDAPFDATMALPEYDIQDFGSIETRWAALVTAASIEPLLRTSNTATVSLPTATISPSITSRTSPSNAAKSSASGTPTDRVAMLRKKRQRQQIFIASGLIGAAFLFLGAAGAYYYNNQRKLAQAKAEADNPTPRPSLTPSGPNDPFLPGILPNDKEPGKQTTVRPSDFRSNLPSIGKDADQGTEKEVLANNGMASADSMPPVEKTPPQSEEMTKDSETMMDSDLAMMSGDKEAEKEMMQPESMTKDPAWTAAMNKAREAIKKADFESFKAEIERALPLNKTDDQEKMYKRLDQVGQLYEIAVTAMKDARKSLRGTEAISVGTGKVNIVEVKEDGLIIRKDGQNVTHKWSELPPGLALSVSNFTLSETDPTDVAARAVYLSLSPNQNAFQEKTIQGLWEKSLGKGSIRSDLPQAFKDVYE
ncbi:MAG: DnaJ domain-containing protein [Pirellula sp.]